MSEEPCSRQLVQSPIGAIYIAANAIGLTHLTFDAARIGQLSDATLEMKKRADKILQKASLQLTEYFTQQRQSFDVPLSPTGTDFQKSVWQALLTTQCGETLSYSEIANQIRRPKAVRGGWYCQWC